MNILDNVDFIIPVYIDHPDRLRNLEICISFLQKTGAKNLFVNEHYKDDPKIKNIQGVKYSAKSIADQDFYNKMECGNETFRNYSINKIVCLYDIDVLIPGKFIKECAEKLIEDYDFGYPYNGYFYDIPLEKVLELKENLSANIDLEQCELFSKTSHGGCVMFTRNCFIDGGKLNPLFKNVGYDDDEINIRFSRLGYRKYRTSNPLLHMTHHRGDTTYNHSKFVNYNGEICHRITHMPIEDLKQLVKQWK